MKFAYLLYEYDGLRYDKLIGVFTRKKEAKAQLKELENIGAPGYNVRMEDVELNKIF